MQQLKKNIFVYAMLMALSIGSACSITAPVYSKTPVEQKPAVKVADEYEMVDITSLSLNPKFYMNKKIKMVVLFDKFSTLGLDYEPAYRDAQKYISFLVKKADNNKHNIPLSEVKLIVLREYAEKNLVDVESGDKIEIKGKVFSDALNDPWVDVSEVNVISKKEKKEEGSL